MAKTYGRKPRISSKIRYTRNPGLRYARFLEKEKRLVSRLDRETSHKDIETSNSSIIEVSRNSKGRVWTFA